MPLLPTGPARRTAVVQLVGFIALPVVCILVLWVYVLATL